MKIIITDETLSIQPEDAQDRAYLSQWSIAGVDRHIHPDGAVPINLSSVGRGASNVAGGSD